MVHSYIYIGQSRDCHIFSLVTVLGNMYNLCKLHSLICMHSGMHSGCHSLSDLHSYTNMDMKQRWFFYCIEHKTRSLVVKFVACTHPSSFTIINVTVHIK